MNDFDLNVELWLTSFDGAGEDTVDDQIDSVYNLMNDLITAGRFDVIEEVLRGVTAERVAMWPLTTSLSFLSITVPVMERLASVRRPLLALIAEHVKHRPDADTLLAGLENSVNLATLLKSF